MVGVRDLVGDRIAHLDRHAVRRFDDRIVDLRRFLGRIGRLVVLHRDLDRSCRFGGIVSDGHRRRVVHRRQILVVADFLRRFVHLNRQRHAAAGERSHALDRPRHRVRVRIVLSAVRRTDIVHAAVQLVRDRHIHAVGRVVGVRDLVGDLIAHLDRHAVRRLDDHIVDLGRFLGRIGRFVVLHGDDHRLRGRRRFADRQRGGIVHGRNHLVGADFLRRFVHPDRQRHAAVGKRIDVLNRPRHRVCILIIDSRDIAFRRIARRADIVHAVVQRIRDRQRLALVGVVAVRDLIGDRVADFNLHAVRRRDRRAIDRRRGLDRSLRLFAVARVGDGEAVRRFLTDLDGVDLSVNRNLAVLSAGLGNRVVVQIALAIILGRAFDGRSPVIAVVQRARRIRLRRIVAAVNLNRHFLRNEICIQRAIAVRPDLGHRNVHRALELVGDGAAVRNAGCRLSVNRHFDFIRDGLDVIALRQGFDHCVGVCHARSIVLREIRIGDRPGIGIAVRNRRGRVNQLPAAAAPAVQGEQVFRRDLALAAIHPFLREGEARLASVEFVGDCAAINRRRVGRVIAANNAGRRLDHAIRNRIAAQGIGRQIREHVFISVGIPGLRDVKRLDGILYIHPGAAAHAGLQLDLDRVRTGAIRVAVVDPDLGHADRRALARVGDGDSDVARVVGIAHDKAIAREGAICAGAGGRPDIFIERVAVCIQLRHRVGLADFQIDGDGLAISNRLGADNFDISILDLEDELAGQTGCAVGRVIHDLLRHGHLRFGAGVGNRQGRAILIESDRLAIRPAALIAGIVVRHDFLHDIAVFTVRQV